MYLLVLWKNQYALPSSSAMMVSIIEWSSVSKKFQASPVLKFYRQHTSPGYGDFS